MNNNFARLIALSIVGGVAKALFAPEVKILRPAMNTLVENMPKTTEAVAEAVQKKDS